MNNRKYRKVEKTDRARQLRADSTFPERLLWSELRNNRFDKKFRRQAPIENYFVDFYCSEAKLVVELDGVSHIGQEKQDASRENFLKSLGLRVIRFSNDEVIKDVHGVVEQILRAAEGIE